MLENQLKQLGLSDKEAVVYEKLSSLGVVQPAALSKPTKLGRTTVYAVLQQMEKKGLVERKDIKGKIHFVVSHPSNLESLIKSREKDLENDKKTLENILPSLTSEYNLVSNKPNVRYFEGIEGLEEVEKDALKAKGELFEFIDAETIGKDFAKHEELLTKKRKKLGIKVKAIVLDSPIARKAYGGKKNLDVKYISHDKYPFYALVMIYDGKISYLKLRKDKIIGVIIEDIDIYNMQRSIFNFVWESASYFD